jgi:chemotaxis protein histidine kinase CheA
MPDDEKQPEKVWDEYDWERFLQEQDHKTERYMELLERYIDDPNRDQIIAREMGWNHLLDKEGQAWADSVDEQFAEELMADVEEEEDGDGEEREDFEVHPLYQAAFSLAAWIDQMFEECGEAVEQHPAAVRLSTQAAVASAKLAAALSDDDVDEIGMTLAYLKRALRAVSLGLENAMQLQDERVIDRARFGQLNRRLFEVRDGVIELMGQYRAEWRRRYGA